MAQDTLVYKTGEKVAIKLYSVTDSKVFYQTLQNTGELSVKTSEIDYIKYADGSRYTLYHGSGFATSKGMVTIGAGIGASLITWGLPNSNAINMSGDLYYTMLTVSPAYNFTIDYNLLNSFSMGLCGAYQSLTDHPDFDGYPETYETEKISRYNMSVRILGHLSKNPLKYAYIGARVGMSIWTDKAIQYTPPGPGLVVPSTSMHSYSRRASFLLFFGYRTFFSNEIGLHIEAGIGSPYILEGGITFRFQTEKNNE